MVEYTQLSRSTPSSVAPRRSIAAPEAMFIHGVRNSTTGQPRTSTAWVGSRSLEPAALPQAMPKRYGPPAVSPAQTAKLKP